LNPYAYVSGNPLNAIDPLGLFSVSGFIRDAADFIYDYSPAGAAGALLEVAIGRLKCAEPSNGFTQALAASAYALAEFAYGIANGPRDLMHQVADFVENPHYTTIPIVGPLGQAIGVTTAAFMENPNLETACEMAKAYLGGALLAAGGVQGYRGITGKGPAAATVAKGKASPSTLHERGTKMPGGRKIEDTLAGSNKIKNEKGKTFKRVDFSPSKPHGGLSPHTHPNFRNTLPDGSVRSGVSGHAQPVTRRDIIDAARKGGQRTGGL